MEVAGITSARILRAGLLALLIGGAGSFAVGFVAAEDTTFQPFAVPLPAPGDAGMYEVTDRGLIVELFQWDGPIHTARSRFEIGEPETLRNATGQLQDVMRVTWTDPDATPAQLAEHEWGWTEFLDARTGGLAALEQTNRWTRAPENGVDFPDPIPLGLFPRPGVNWTSLQRTFGGERFETRFCGFLTQLQGADEVPDNLTVTGNCQTQHTVVQPWEWETLSEGDAMRWTSADGNFSLWFAPEVPYPIRIELLDGPMEDPFWHRIVKLVGFERGRPSSPSGSAAGPMGPTLIYAPRTRLGPSADGFPMTFSLEHAWNEATRNATFAAWLEQNPDAPVLSAAYSELDGRNRYERRWSFLPGGNSPIQITVKKFEDHAPQQVPQPLAGLAPASVSYRVEVSKPLSWERYSAPLPATLPTVASVAAWWDLYAPDEGLPIAYGFRIDCADFLEAENRTPTCTQDESGVGVGYSQWTESSNGLPLGPSGFSLEHRMMYVSLGQDGRLRSITVAERESEGGNGIVSGATPLPPFAASAPEPGPLLFGRWTVPPPQAAAQIGVGALALAILYAIWPAVKTSALGFFSRVGREPLAAHPARAQILDAVESSPGIHYRGLVQATGLGKGTVEHHVRRLVAARALVARSGGGYTCYFLPDASQRGLGSTLATKPDGARSILEVVLRQPGMTSRDVAQAAGVQPSTVSHHLPKLVDAGLVATIHEGRTVRLHPGPQTATART